MAAASPRLASSGPHRKLNVSSGDHYASGWVNFDLAPQRRLDLRADLLRLPFPDAVFSRVYVGHTLEHLDWGDVPTAMRSYAG